MMLSMYTWRTDKPADDDVDILLPEEMFKARVGLSHEGGWLGATGVSRIDANGFATYVAGRTAATDVGDQPATYRRSLKWAGIDTFRAQGAARHRLSGEIARSSERNATERAVDTRVAELRAAASDEGIVWSTISEQGLRGFMERTGTTAPPFLTLRPDGNLRALWERSDGAQIGLQFLDRFRISYVLFVPASNGEIDRHFGTTARSRLSALIRHFQLHSLLTA